jgi:xanthine dehydrogenase molybdopterin-binding subunit B
LGVRPEVIREKNMYNEGDKTYYGTVVPKNVKNSWFECKKSSDFENRLKEVEKFNKSNKYRKRGISLMPSKYGVGFETTAHFQNQGSFLSFLHKE